MTNLPAISVIIPAYNEESRLPVYLAQVLAYLRLKGPSFEVIVVDDGSSDGTALLVERSAELEPRLRLIRLPGNQGKGAAVRTGMLQAHGKLRLFADADGATPITELERLRKSIDQGADVVVGSRALHDASRKVRSKLHRRIMGTVFNYLVRVLAVHGIEDTQCGFKLFTAAAARAVFALQRIDRFGFDVEILFLSHKKGYRITEVPVNWSDVAGTKVSLVWDSLRMFGDLLRIRCNDWRGGYRGQDLKGGLNHEKAEKSNPGL
jgi:dolichyl-phosphate beta-glucosyltransferase